MITCGNYIVGDKISAGTYGVVYNAVNKRTRQHVAIKFARKIEGRSTLVNEARIMIHLRRTIPIPRIRDYGIYKDDVNYLAMDLLGPPLYYDNIIQNKAEEPPRGRMSINLLNICMQLLNIMRQLHRSGFIYRDVKPSNFLMGQSPNRWKVYLIDLGFVKRIPPKSVVNDDIRTTPVGTIDYMSVNAHEGREQTRRDDLESLAYLFYYMHNGSLPWAGLTNHTSVAREKRENEEFKRKCPPNVANYLKFVSDYEANEVPDYKILEKTLSHLIIF